MNIAILGGSITEGAGASEYKKSYVYQLESYFKEKYGDAVVKNLGSGGTASQFGLFRLERDLGGFKPDIIFIEFAVNDRVYSAHDINIYFEGVVRKCLEITSNIIILDLPCKMGNSSSSIHKKIAYFYNIPVIDVQDEVFRRIGKREVTWTQISIDDQHPNDLGHNLYFKIIKENIEKININEIKPNIDYKVLSKYRFIKPMLIDYDDKKIEYYGQWKDKELNLNNKMKNVAFTSYVGDGVIFEFKGRYLSMMSYLTSNSGILECQLDNFVFTVDLYADSSGIFDTTININDLSSDVHKLIMKVSEKKNEKSTGNDIMIGGFLIDPGFKGE